MAAVSHSASMAAQASRPGRPLPKAAKAEPQAAPAFPSSSLAASASPAATSRRCSASSSVARPGLPPSSRSVSALTEASPVAVLFLGCRGTSAMQARRKATVLRGAFLLRSGSSSGCSFQRTHSRFSALNSFPTRGGGSSASSPAAAPSACAPISSAPAGASASAGLLRGGRFLTGAWAAAAGAGGAAIASAKSRWRICGRGQASLGPCLRPPPAHGDDRRALRKPRTRQSRRKQAGA